MLAPAQSGMAIGNEIAPPSSDHVSNRQRETLKYGTLANVVTNQNGKQVLARPNRDQGNGAPAPPPSQQVYQNQASQNQDLDQWTTVDNQRQNRVNYADAAARHLPPGLNPDNSRYHHSQNNRGGSNSATNPTRSNNSNPLPRVVRSDYMNIDPETDNVKLVKDFKSVPTRSEKQINREKKRHKKNLDEVLCEVILFDIPTRNRNGDIASKNEDKDHVVRILRELKRGGYTVKTGDVIETVRQWKNTQTRYLLPSPSAHQT